MENKTNVIPNILIKCWAEQFPNLNAARDVSFAFLKLDSRYVLGKVTDNQSTNVNAIKNLLGENDGDKQHFIAATGSETKTFLFYDIIQLIKTSGKIYSTPENLCFYGSSLTFMETS